MEEFNSNTEKEKESPFSLLRTEVEREQSYVWSRG